MNRYELADHFPYQEFFHPDYIEYFKLLGWSEARIFEHLRRWVNPVFIDTYVSLRNRYGALYINDWHIGGKFKNAGKRLRPFTHNGRVFGESVGASMSSHYESNATADFHFIKTTPEEVQDDIMRDQDKLPHIYRMENAQITGGWMHVESGERMPGGIIIFNP